MLNRLRESRWPRWVLVLIALAFCAYGLASRWDETTEAVARLSVWSMIGAVGAFGTGLWCACLAWRAILAGFGNPLPVRVALQVYFIGQLAKFIPGTVWAIAATAELGRDHGCPPRRTFAATVTALATTVACGLSTAALTLPGAPRWIAPVFLLGLHPRILAFGLNLLMRIARREPLDVLPGRTMIVAIGWTFLAIACFGLMFSLPLADISGRAVPDVYLTATGAYLLGWAGALLLVVFPAGAGAREIALAGVLAPILPWHEGLIVALAARLAVTLADLGWGGTALLIKVYWRHVDPSHTGSRGEPPRGDQGGERLHRDLPRPS